MSERSVYTHLSRSLLFCLSPPPLPSSLPSKGAVYLKNYIHKYWKEKEAVDGEETVYTIPEGPKSLIRENIVEAIIQTPHLIRLSKSEEECISPHPV